MNDFPLPRILDFIQKVSPFDTLDDEERSRVVARMEIAYYPRGEVLIRRGDNPPEYLYIIQVGSARITISDGSDEEVLVDVRGEGDVFGSLNILESKAALLDVTADEDMIVYLLPAEVLKNLVESHPAFKQYFRFSLFSLARDIKNVYQSDDSRFSQMTGIKTLNLDMFLVGKHVADLMATDVLTCTAARSVQFAARQMTRRGAGSIVINDDSGVPLGILTDSDLRKKVVAEGSPLDVSVAEIMSHPLYTINAGAFAFDALLDMSRYGVRHLLVMENDRLTGIISDHDFQMETGSSPVGVIGDIDKSQSVDELVGMHSKVDRVLEMLLRQGGSVKRMVELVTELNDRVTRKLLFLIEGEMKDEGLGAPPSPYTWMALGSEGRREQTLLTDQDNALFFAAVPEQNEEEVKAWFLKFSKRVVDGLVRYGFPPCPGGIMASNPRWCQSESRWLKTFLDWINEPEPFTLRMATIFFDFRPIYEGADFLNTFRPQLSKAIQGNPHFLRSLAKNGLYNAPLGFLRQFVVEKSGEHKNKLNLKVRGLVPIVDAARVMALDLGVETTNTLERLAEVHRMGILDTQLHNDLREAYNFINLLRISRHLEARARGHEPDNFVDPVELNSLQRKMLKESFAVINRLLHDLVEWRYQARGMEDQ